MDQFKIFNAALEISSPWFIREVNFDKKEGSLHPILTIEIDFFRGSIFKGNDGKMYTVYDTNQRTWQHLNFFQHQCFIVAPMPRIMLEDGSTHNVEVPWAREGSHFTLLFESYCMDLISSEMTFSKVGRLMNINFQRVARIFNYWVTKALENQDLSTVTVLGIDETSIKKGHNYVTVAVDLDTKAVIHVTTGKDSSTLKVLKEHLKDNSGHPEKVNMISMDMSPAFISGAQEHFPKAAITFDKFHVVKLINTAMDKTRNAEQKNCQELKGTRYFWLKNDSNLKDKQIAMRDLLVDTYPNIGLAYRLKQQFKAFWTQEKIEDAKVFLIEWCKQAEASDLVHFFKVAQSIRYHLEGVK